MSIEAADAFMAIFGFKRVQEDKMNTQTGMKPVADKDDILTAFEELIDENGTTTTLEVKKALREDGFWVKQDDVSEVIAEYVDYDAANEYTFTIDRNHRVYEKASPSTAPLPSYVGKPKAVQKVGTWKVTGGADEKTYCDMTRNQARYLFSIQFDIPYIKTRATVAQ